MTGKYSGVSARFKDLHACKTCLSVHCICHRLALACADTGDGLAFVNTFETTMTSLWIFFKNSPKRLKVYIKETLNCRNFSNLGKNKNKRLVKTVKRAVRTRWLSLDNSVNAVFDEYVGIVKALEKIDDATAKGVLKKINNVDFLGKLYLFKHALPHLSALSKTFQTGAINFSKIKPSLLKTKLKLRTLIEEEPHIKELQNDLLPGGRLSMCGKVMNEHALNLITGRTEAYVNSICGNIDDRFPQDTTDVLSVLDVFNVESLPGDPSSQIFRMHGNAEMKMLGNHFYRDNEEKKEILSSQWNDFKFQFLEVRKKWMQFKENVENNKLKLHTSSTEWTPKHLMMNLDGNEHNLLKDIVKTAMVTPVSNAWPERGASAIKRIKSRLRSSINEEMLNCLLMISINGPAPGTETAENFLKKALLKFEKKRNYKVPTKNAFHEKKHFSIAVQTMDEEEENIHVDVVIKKLDTTLNSFDLRAEIESDSESEGEELDTDSESE